MSELNRILTGNCIDIMSRMKQDTFDMIFADPPVTLADFYYEEENCILSGSLKALYYNINEDHTNIDYTKFTEQWVSNAKKLLKKDGSLYILTSKTNIAEIIITCKKLNFHFINLITWNKINHQYNHSDKSFTNKCEYLLLFTKDRNHIFNKDLLKKGKAKKTSDIDALFNLWNIPLVNHDNKSNKDEIPEELIRRAIIASTNYGSVLLEPFCKTGLPCAVALKNDRNYIGIAPNSKIAKTSINRINRIRRQITKTYKKGQVDLFIRPVSKN